MNGRVYKMGIQFRYHNVYWNENISVKMTNDGDGHHSGVSSQSPQGEKIESEKLMSLM